MSSPAEHRLAWRIVAIAAPMAAVLGCEAPTRTAPPPLRSSAATPPRVDGPDPIPQDDARRAFEEQPAAQGAGRGVEPAARPSAMAWLDMTLPPAQPEQVAVIAVPESPAEDRAVAVLESP